MSEYFRKYIKKEHYPVHPSNIKFKTSFKNCILEALRRRQWREIETDDWDIYWSEKEWIQDIMDHFHLTSNQRINHYRNYYELCRKDMMIKNLKKHIKQLQKEQKNEEALSYCFIPMTYHLPSEYSIFCEEFKKCNSQADQRQLWIMKPISKAQGKGIFLFKNIKDIASWKNTYRYNPENPQAEPYIVQKYISEPLLIGGKKFDLRIYALCVQYQPLTIYLYRTGFARFTHHRYDTEDITNTYIHLTNVAIQKTSENYDEKLGGKWFLQTLKLYLISKYGQEKVSECFFNIQNIIIKALQSVQKQMMNDKRSFELYKILTLSYGFDILLDQCLKPWLLEINASPSMTANTGTDHDIKVGLLDDVFTIVDMEKILTGQEEQIGGFDLIYRGFPVKLPSNSTYSSLLGCYNNRNQQLKKLAKSTAIRLAQQYNENQPRQNGMESKQRSSSKGPTIITQNLQQQQQQQQQQGQLKLQQQNQKPNYSQQSPLQPNPQKVIIRNPNPQIPTKVVRKPITNGTNNNSISKSGSGNQANSQNQNQINGGQQVGSIQLQTTGTATSQSSTSASSINSKTNQQNGQNGQKPSSPPRSYQTQQQRMTTNQKLKQLNEEKKTSEKFEPYKKEEQRYAELINARGPHPENDED